MFVAAALEAFSFRTPRDCNSKASSSFRYCLLLVLTTGRVDVFLRGGTRMFSRKFTRYYSGAPPGKYERESPLCFWYVWNPTKNLDNAHACCATGLRTRSREKLDAISHECSRGYTNFPLDRLSLSTAAISVAMPDRMRVFRGTC